MKIIVIRKEDNLEVEMHDDGSVISITDIDPDYDLAMEEFGEGPATRARVFLAMQRDPLHFLMQELLLTSKSGIPNFMFDCVEHALAVFIKYTGFKRDNNIAQLKTYYLHARSVYDVYGESLVLFNGIRRWFHVLNYVTPESRYVFSPEGDDWVEFAKKYSKIQRDVFLDIIRGLLSALGYRDGLMGYRISPMDGSIQKELLSLCHVEVLGTELQEGRMPQEWYEQTDERKWQLRRFFKYVAKTAKGRKRLLP